jgi:hypothetical protein
MFIEYLTMRTTNGDVKQMCWNSIISQEIMTSLETKIV